VTRTTWLRVAAVGAVLLGGAGAALVGREHSGRSTPDTGVSIPAEPADRPLPTSPLVAPPALRPSFATAAPAPPVTAGFDEPALMDRLRNLEETDPERAVDLAREGNGRFPDSPDAPERTSLLIHALARLGRASEARAEAETMVNEYDDSRWVREVERFTGAHRHRNVRITEDGAVDFY
jgi:hypothetical protein